MVRRIAAIVALLLALELVGCSLIDDRDPSPSPGSMTSPPRPTPKVDPTQKDISAARDAYVVSFKEINRLEMAGGTTTPTKVLLATTSGTYRDLVMQLLRQDKKAGLRLTRSGKLLGFSMGPWTPMRIRLTACEDFTGSNWVNSKGVVKRTGDGVMYRHTATAVKGSDGHWRIDKLGGGRADSLETADCNQGGEW
jgi:hypothetical protein